MKLVYLPIDSRPCNRLFPVQLLDLSAIHCVTPPPEDMDCFQRPAPHERTVEFLKSQTRAADILIVSIDQLLYGSLLASREDILPMDEALRRLQCLAALKEANPELQILALSVIMRSSISTLKTEDLGPYHAVTAYSQAFHRAKLSGAKADLDEMERLARTIPTGILNQYQSARARNHRINQACVSLVQRRVIDRLLLLQEDSQALGFHRLEQQALWADVARFKVADRVTLHNGTDEGGCLCAATIARKPLKLHVRELGGGGCHFTAKYEDRPFAENIASHCRFAGIGLTSAADADKLLCVLTPGAQPQRDASDPATQSPDMLERNERLAKELAGYMAGGKPVGLLDVQYANGGSISFMEALAKRADPMNLAAYAAWNTASNALGTVLAQLALGGEGEQNRRFTAERLLDDLLYQSAVRGRLQAELVAAGEDPLALADKGRAEHRLTQLMHEAAWRTPVFAGYDIEAAYTLPWPRTFEAGVSVRRIIKRRKGGGFNG